ncbi:hypothetical protein [Aureimonas sp. ME7]|uniref:hypothetical protein n=1 Tax=Aureimonas sp. ME7 TaxID=2744252 RepID=UPI0015F375E6|nr:hypothetical protein [Aureimonas sp. ME7]
MKDRIHSIGKLGLPGTFKAGAALEERRVLLRSDHSSCVRTEYGPEPRSALGCRKTFRILTERRGALLEHGVSADVTIMVACAQPEARERALAAILSGRSLSEKDAKQILTSVANMRQPGRPPSNRSPVSCVSSPMGSPRRWRGSASGRRARRGRQFPLACRVFFPGEQRCSRGNGTEEAIPVGVM